MIRNSNTRDDSLLKPIGMFQHRGRLSRPAGCYEPEDVQGLQKLTHELEQTEDTRADKFVLSLMLEKHPDKTFIGRLSRGLYAWDYQFAEEGLTGPSEKQQNNKTII